MPTTTWAEAPDAVDRRLLTAATFFTAVVLFHGFDHFRRGVNTINRDVFLAGSAAMVLGVGLVVLAGAALGYVGFAGLAARGGLDTVNDPLRGAGRHHDIGETQATSPDCINSDHPSNL